MGDADNLKKCLIKEKDMNYNGGLYHETQIKLAYNSNRIEGSTLTEDQTLYLYDTKSIENGENGFVSSKDIIEMNNHFILFNNMLNTISEPLTADIIKHFHRILKTGTVRDSKYETPIGKYKFLPNTVAGITTSEPYAVAKDIEDLLIRYNDIKSKEIEDIVDMHVRFERIHPFFDGNGRIGRLIIFRECLINGITPLIIEDNEKAVYYKGLKEYLKDKEPLIEFCRLEQARYAERIKYYTVATVDKVTNDKEQRQ
jgi:Fic family protein